MKGRRKLLLSFFVFENKQSRKEKNTPFFCCGINQKKKRSYKKQFLVCVCVCELEKLFCFILVHLQINNNNNSPAKNLYI
jgi:hypothetical protein